MRQQETISPRKSVTVIVPVFNEEENLPRCRRALADLFESMPGYDFRALLVDDGSADRSWEIIKETAAGDARFAGARLSRNFGSHAAIAAGFELAAADAYVVLACDLQDPPEKIPEMIKMWEDGTEIVFGARDLTGEGLMRGAISRLFYRLMHRAAPPGAAYSTGSFYLVNEKPARVFRQMTDRYRLTFAMLVRIGFRQGTVRYTRARRTAGKSGWSAGAKIAAFCKALAVYTKIPARLCFAAFAMLLCASVALGIFRPRGAAQFSPAAFLCLLFSMQFALLGLAAALYKGIHGRLGNGPLFVVRDSINIENSNVDGCVINIKDYGGS